MNSNEREQVEQIRERHLRVDCYKSQMRTDINFLLSLLDSQVESIELLRKIPAVANDALNMTLSQIQGDAATRMRDLCVEKVRELQRDWDKAQSYDFRDATFYIVTALESVTLEAAANQVEKKQ